MGVRGRAGQGDHGRVSAFHRETGSVSSLISWNNLKKTISKTLKGRTFYRKDNECTSSSTGIPGRTPSNDAS